MNRREIMIGAAAAVAATAVPVMVSAAKSKSVVIIGSGVDKASAQSSSVARASKYQVENGYSSRGATEVRYYEGESYNGMRTYCMTTYTFVKDAA